MARLPAQVKASAGAPGTQTTRPGAPRARRALLGSCLAVLLAGVASAAPAPPAEDLTAGRPGGPWRRLFLDSMVVERQEGLTRVFHAAEKHPANPVIRRDKPWEGESAFSGPYLYGTILWDEGKLRMWYHCYDSGYRNCYAESADGIRWTKPSLGILEFKGSKENNLFLTNSQDPAEKPPFAGAGQCHNPSVIKRPSDPDPAKRYALFCYGADYRHARVAYSPDGLHWSFASETVEKALFTSSDVLNFFHDPYRSRYVATWKSGNRRGRAAGVAWSPDGVTWTKPVEGPVFSADDLDPDATQVYGMPVFPYQGLYVGLPWIYNARWFKSGTYTDQRMYEAERDSPCTMDVQLAWSWDLIQWTRPPERSPLIPRGKAGEFDSGMIYTARAPVQVGDRLFFYYGGWDGPHNAPKAAANIGLATLRLDGFCSMRAGEREGWLVSRRETFRVPRVTVNARAATDGYLTAEILDGSGQVIPGFSREECAPFRGDAVAHALRWKTTEFPAAQVDGEKKIRFFLKNADLYSYLPDQAPGKLLVTYVPSGNGGLLASDGGIPPGQRFAMHGKPSGFRIVREGNLAYADLHSAAAEKTSAQFMRDADWTDDTDWCLEAWYRLADAGNEPNYGLASFMHPASGRNAALFLSATSAGILSSVDNTHKTLRTVDLDTTDRFHWYRLVHSGGEKGSVALEVDGKEAIRIPFAELFSRPGVGGYVCFGPNAAHREGRLHVARFGYRVGGTEPIFGPVTP